MKEALVLCVISALLPGLHGITCSHCPLGDGNCNNCTGKFCFTLLEVTTADQTTNRTYRGCLDSAVCNPVSITLSTFQNRHSQISTACCESEMCNEKLQLSVSPRGDSENGVNCKMCEKENGVECPDQSFACRGLEQKCFSLKGISTADGSKNITLKGCASENSCGMKGSEIIAYQGKTYMLSEDILCADKGILSAQLSPAAIFLPAFIGYFLVNLLPDL